MLDVVLHDLLISSWLFPHGARGAAPKPWRLPHASAYAWSSRLVLEYLRSAYIDDRFVDDPQHDYFRSDICYISFYRSEHYQQSQWLAEHKPDEQA